jgi:hypothetical protein
VYFSKHVSNYLFCLFLLSLSISLSPSLMREKKRGIIIFFLLDGKMKKNQGRGKKKK